MMRRFGTSLLIGLVSVFAMRPCQAQEPSRYEKWQASRPFTISAGYYDAPFGPAAAWPPPSLHPDMDLWRQAGLNVLVDVSHENGGHQDYPGVPAAQAAGVPFMILGAGWAGKGAPTAMSSFQKHVRFFANDPATWSRFCGVQLGNEPPESQWDDVRRQRDWLVATYPHLLTLLNRVVTANRDGVFDWQREMNLVQPDAFIFQFLIYHVMDGNQPDISPGVYACLDRASEYCKARGIGFFIEREAYDWGASVRRINTYASLVYGARGFVDWYWDSGHNSNSTSPTQGYVWYDHAKREAGYTWRDYDNKQPGEGGPTSLFAIMAQINREVSHLGPALISLRHVRTYHLDIESGPQWSGPIYHFDDLDDLRSGNLLAVTATTDCPDLLDTGTWKNNRRTDRVMIGFFRDDNGEEYFMVVNKNNTGDPDLPLSRFFRRNDPEELLLAEKITLTFAPQVKGIERLSRLTGKVEDLALRDQTFSFSLRGGTGDLFKYATGKPFAGMGPAR